jgi:hypothetical protein
MTCNCSSSGCGCASQGASALMSGLGSPGTAPLGSVGREAQRLGPLAPPNMEHASLMSESMASSRWRPLPIARSGLSAVRLFRGEAPIGVAGQGAGWSAYSPSIVGATANLRPGQTLFDLDPRQPPVEDAGRDLDEPTDTSTLDAPTGVRGCTCNVSGKVVRKTDVARSFRFRITGGGVNSIVWGGGRIHIWWHTTTILFHRVYHVTTTKCVGDDCTFSLRIKSRLVSETKEYLPQIGPRNRPWYAPNDEDHYWHDWQYTSMGDSDWFQGAAVTRATTDRWIRELLDRIGYDPTRGDELSTTRDSNVSVLSGADVAKLFLGLAKPPIPPPKPDKPLEGLRSTER